MAQVMFWAGHGVSVLYLYVLHVLMAWVDLLG